MIKSDNLEVRKKFEKVLEEAFRESINNAHPIMIFIGVSDRGKFTIKSVKNLISDDNEYVFMKYIECNDKDKVINEGFLADCVAEAMLDYDRITKTI